MSSTHGKPTQTTEAAPGQTWVATKPRSRQAPKRIIGVGQSPEWEGGAWVKTDSGTMSRIRFEMWVEKYRAEAWVS